MKKTKLWVVGLVLAMVAALPAMAQTPYDPITGAVDFSDVLTGVVAIAALIATVLVGIRGVRWIIATLRR